MRYRIALFCLAGALAAGSANAAPVLIDFTNGGAAASAADFTSAGVTEDISGASVMAANIAGGNWNTWNSTVYSNAGLSVQWAAGSDLFTYNSGAANALLDEVLYTDQSRSGPVVAFNVNGLASNLSANSDYKAYVFVSGLWSSDPRKYQLDYGTYHAEAMLSTGAYLTLPFHTGASVSAPLTITMGDASGYPGITGIAVVPVPEPTIIGCVAGISGFLALRRRR